MQCSPLAGCCAPAAALADGRLASFDPSCVRCAFGAVRWGQLRTLRRMAAPSIVVVLVLFQDFQQCSTACVGFLAHSRPRQARRREERRSGGLRSREAREAGGRRAGREALLLSLFFVQAAKVCLEGKQGACTHAGDRNLTSPRWAWLVSFPLLPSCVHKRGSFPERPAATLSARSLLWSFGGEAQVAGSCPCASPHTPTRASSSCLACPSLVLVLAWVHCRLLGAGRLGSLHELQGRASVGATERLMSSFFPRIPPPAPRQHQPATPHARPPAATPSAQSPFMLCVMRVCGRGAGRVRRCRQKRSPHPALPHLRCMHHGPP